ncbi:hypothetical protein N8H72_20880 [Pseudomonas koreensis]|uniref:hypothetical protein n=1 Tax=Pseudomonas koreensis TaxID=198620 RepID=UPI0021C7B175|nr:hypothetical protein [Pseudomonas koreensis]MCU0092441.1 hypothetical protein [Pseudomonas koreensis]
MKMRKIILGAVLLVFSPERFATYATRIGIEHEFINNAELKKAYPNEKAPPEVETEWHKHNYNRAITIRRAFFSSLVITFASIIIGIVIGLQLKSLIGNPSILTTNVIQVLGVGILLSATLSVVGSKIESMKGETLAEHIDRALFRWQYIIGSSLFFLALSWSS